MRTYAIIAGRRDQPGRTIETFSSADHHACGGAATACLRAFERLARRGVVAHFRRVK